MTEKEKIEKLESLLWYFPRDEPTHDTRLVLFPDGKFGLESYSEEGKRIKSLTDPENPMTFEELRICINTAHFYAEKYYMRGFTDGVERSKSAIRLKEMEKSQI